MIDPLEPLYTPSTWALELRQSCSPGSATQRLIDVLIGMPLAAKERNRD